MGGFDDLADELPGFAPLHGLAGRDGFVPPFVVTAAGFHESSVARTLLLTFWERWTVASPSRSSGVRPTHQDAKPSFPALAFRLVNLLASGWSTWKITRPAAQHILQPLLITPAEAQVEALRGLAGRWHAHPRRGSHLLRASARRSLPVPQARLEGVPPFIARSRIDSSESLAPDDEAGRALADAHAAAVKLGRAAFVLVVDPAVAGRIFDAHVGQPHRGIDSNLLGGRRGGRDSMRKPGRPARRTSMEPITVRATP